MNIPYRELRERLESNVLECKTTQTYDNSIISKALFGFITKLINKCEHMTEYETGIFIRSLDKWLDRKDVDNTAENGILPKPGDVCMIDWSIGYTPELAYSHPGLIINIVNDLLVVIPVSSTHTEDAFHPIDNPTGNVLYRKVSKIDGFKKECALHLAEMKVISQSRIINRICELLPNDVGENKLYNEIQNSLFSIYFNKEKKYYTNTLSILEQKLNSSESLRRKYQSRMDHYRLRCEYLEKRLKLSSDS